MKVLLDTNILSELVRPRPDPRVVDWFGGLSTVSLSTVTVEEVFFGLTLKRNLSLERWFDEFFTRDCEILEVSIAIARHAGVLRGQLARRGHVRSQADMLIAATAAIHGLTVATRNERDFTDCGVTLVNPFD